MSRAIPPALETPFLRLDVKFRSFAPNYLNTLNQEEINRRRTFGIISHPDAGKTTLTEKILLFGGAIKTAGAVKMNKITKTATSASTKM